VQVRKRDASFPEEPGKVTTAAQPAALPHSDFSRDGGFLAMEQFFPGQQKYFENRDFDLIKYASLSFVKSSPGSH
jgi:hypothetical protein